MFGGSFTTNLFNILTILPAQLIAAYTLVYYQIPKWLFREKWIRFSFSFVIIALCTSVMARLSVLYIAEPLIGLEYSGESLWHIISDPLYLIKVYFISVYLPAFVLFLIKMTMERFVQQNDVEILEKEKRTAELNFLKAQMNPHFLFNTLNNIYALSSKGSSNTPDMILKLSEILDYTLYECNAARVPVLREWTLIENYADLEVLRYGDRLDLLLSQKIDNEEALIAPLILISIVENAFKYSLGRHDKVPSVRIILTLKEGRLDLEVVNSKNDKNYEKKKNKNHGIGINNLRRQLKLQYPNGHNIRIDDGQDYYKVNLNIQL